VQVHGCAIATDTTLAASVMGAGEYALPHHFFLLLPVLQQIKDTFPKWN